MTQPVCVCFPYQKVEIMKKFFSKEVSIADKLVLWSIVSIVSMLYFIDLRLLHPTMILYLLVSLIVFFIDSQLYHKNRRLVLGGYYTFTSYVFSTMCLLVIESRRIRTLTIYDVIAEIFFWSYFIGIHVSTIYSAWDYNRLFEDDHSPRRHVSVQDPTGLVSVSEDVSYGSVNPVFVSDVEEERTPGETNNSRREDTTIVLYSSQSGCKILHDGSEIVFPGTTRMVEVATSTSCSGASHQHHNTVFGLLSEEQTPSEPDLTPRAEMYSSGDETIRQEREEKNEPAVGNLLEIEEVVCVEESTVPAKTPRPTAQRGSESEGFYDGSKDTSRSVSLSRDESPVDKQQLSVLDAASAVLLEANSGTKDNRRRSTSLTVEPRVPSPGDQVRRSSDGDVPKTLPIINKNTTEAPEGFRFRKAKDGQILEPLPNILASTDTLPSFFFDDGSSTTSSEKFTYAFFLRKSARKGLGKVRGTLTDDLNETDRTIRYERPQATSTPTPQENLSMEYKQLLDQLIGSGGSGAELEVLYTIGIRLAPINSNEKKQKKSITSSEENHSVFTVNSLGLTDQASSSPEPNSNKEDEEASREIANIIDEPTQDNDDEVPLLTHQPTDDSPLPTYELPPSLRLSEDTVNPPVTSSWSVQESDLRRQQVNRIRKKVAALKGDSVESGELASGEASRQSSIEIEPLDLSSITGEQATSANDERQGHVVQIHSAAQSTNHADPTQEIKSSDHSQIVRGGHSQEHHVVVIPSSNPVWVLQHLGSQPGPDSAQASDQNVLSGSRPNPDGSSWVPLTSTSVVPDVTSLPEWQPISELCELHGRDPDSTTTPELFRIALIRKRQVDVEEAGEQIGRNESVHEVEGSRRQREHDGEKSLEEKEVMRMMQEGDVYLEMSDTTIDLAEDDRRRKEEADRIRAEEERIRQEAARHTLRGRIIAGIIAFFGLLTWFIRPRNSRVAPNTPRGEEPTPAGRADCDVHGPEARLKPLLEILEKHSISQKNISRSILSKRNEESAGEQQRATSTSPREVLC